MNILVVAYCVLLSWPQVLAGSEKVCLHHKGNTCMSTIQLMDIKKNWATDLPEELALSQRKKTENSLYKGLLFSAYATSFNLCIKRTGFYSELGCLGGIRSFRKRSN